MTEQNEGSADRQNLLDNVANALAAVQRAGLLPQSNIIDDIQDKNKPASHNWSNMSSATSAMNESNLNKESHRIVKSNKLNDTLEPLRSGEDGNKRLQSAETPNLSNLDLSLIHI